MLRVLGAPRLENPVAFSNVGRRGQALAAMGVPELARVAIPAQSAQTVASVHVLGTGLEPVRSA